MTLTQELTTIESIVALTISDLRALEPKHDVAKNWKEALLDALSDCRKEIDHDKVKAVLHRQ